MVLKFLRKKKTMKRIVWGLAIIIIPAFVIWGAGSGGRDKKKGPSYAGKLFSRNVSFDEYADMWYVTRDNLTRNMGRNVPSKLIDELTWNRILLLEGAKKNRLTVKDSELLDNIMSFPVFQRNGNFDKELYKSMLGDAAKAFEEKIRDEIKIAKLRQKISSSVYLTDEEIESSYKNRFEKVKASYVSITFSEFQKDLLYKEGDLVFFYDNNKELFRKPEQKNVEYIEVAFSSFDDEVLIEEEEITKYFEKNSLDFQDPEDPEAIPVLDEGIREKISTKLKDEKKLSMAEDLSYKILDKVFEKQDLKEGSISFGIPVQVTGLFSQEDKIPNIGWSYDFTKTAFELAEEEISSKLIKTDNGFSIIRLKDKKDSFIPEFTVVKEDVIKEYIKEESISLARKKAEEHYEKLSSEAASGKPFSKTAKEIGLEVKETDFITRGDYIATLGPAKDFVDKASLLVKNQIATPTKMLDSWVILKLDDYEDIDEKKYLEEKVEFEKELLGQKQQYVFNMWFENFKKEAKFISYTLNNR
ncbi:MAG: SurA N-terminal domain-containing protein [Candidatus Omnitrophota bacterium]